jgi:hypothetical protein
MTRANLDDFVACYRPGDLYGANVSARYLAVCRPAAMPPIVV